ncbi:hypothetical protein BS50DRAFT_580158 [Corynespora cassiicola Philippines]|uniref:Malate dehydrogenase n=1 Tax=Corynespora cassiicola Philippines TaxID=1448308 RepID=A0A2T2N138_CORCC|nr:hypothetical protein BS50DRAFT_580158 [Corynespora cassiicola Philippines]
MRFILRAFVWSGIVLSSWADSATNSVGRICSGREICDLTLPPSSLPSPEAGSTLRFVGLGVGTQNYTCTPGQPPTSRGAVATLLDIAGVLCANQPPECTSVESLRLGHHYFTADLVPTFDLIHTRADAFVSAKRSDSAGAPESKDSTIDWLRLVADHTKINSGGIATTYRVKTVGGVPPSNCEGETIVPYMAEYWFYGRE